jgi:ABC-type antimicrobial peptide transport system permease subunit
VAQVQRGVIGKTLLLILVGITTGSIASLVVARAISALLFGTTPTDPVTFAAVMVTLAMVALFAGYLPARKASRIDPMVALRNY